MLDDVLGVVLDGVFVFVQWCCCCLHEVLDLHVVQEVHLGLRFAIEGPVLAGTFPIFERFYPILADKIS